MAAGNRFLKKLLTMYGVDTFDYRGVAAAVKNGVIDS